MRVLITILLIVAGISGGRAQTAAFPYPDIPATLTSNKARFVYCLENFWTRYQFADTTQHNRKVAEQGIVEYINLMQYADSVTGACAASILADSIAQHGGECALLFEGLIDHYLGGAEAPLRNDLTYAHLLRALPPSPQRTFLLREVTKNQVGTVAADLEFMNEDNKRQRLHDIRSQLTLVVFYDTRCEDCMEHLPAIRESQDLRSNAFRMATVYIDTEANPQAMQAYYLPSLPSLYLLDPDKRVLVKGGSLQQVIDMLHLILNERAN